MIRVQVPTGGVGSYMYSYTPTQIVKTSKEGESSTKRRVVFYWIKQTRARVGLPQITCAAKNNRK